jgi:hypothetical protein
VGSSTAVNGKSDSAFVDIIQIIFTLHLQSIFCYYTKRNVVFIISENS